MSDVSKTSELIEKLALAAEDAAGGPPSAEQVDALIEYADALRDALEAATRVPVQGEPNDDWNALNAALNSVHLSDWEDAQALCVKSLADAVVDAGFSRATVPDAATDDMSVPEFCEALGFVDGSTTPTRLRDIVEPIQWWDSEARDHVECARICEQCGETLARTLCGECHGGGQRDGGNGTVRECGNCGGAGWLHEGCAEVSYADLVAERVAALAAIERVRAAVKPWGSILSAAKGEVLAALDGAPEPEEKP